jgi:hypothetical protein
MKSTAALLLSAIALSAQGPPGPEVGAKVPDFKLSDQNGTNRTLKSLLGPKGLMLVFFRSADW